MAKYKLKEGVVLEPYGERSSITNENLTDVIAAHLLEHGRAKLEDFETVDEEAYTKVIPPDPGTDASGKNDSPVIDPLKDPPVIETVTGAAVEGAKGDIGKSKVIPPDPGTDSKK